MTAVSERLAPRARGKEGKMYLCRYDIQFLQGILVKSSTRFEGGAHDDQRRVHERPMRGALFIL